MTGVQTCALPISNKQIQVDALKNAASLTSKAKGEAKRLQVEALKSAAPLTNQQKMENKRMQIDALKSAAQLTEQKRQHNTKLSHEAAQADKQALQKFSAGGEVSEKKNESNDYDYAGYRNAVAKGLVKPKEGEEDHYPDTFKLPNHVTFSNESMYSNEKTPEIGRAHV